MLSIFKDLEGDYLFSKPLDNIKVVSSLVIYCLKAIQVDKEYINCEETSFTD